MTNSRELLAGRDCLLIDLDGVVYAGESALPGAAEAVRRFRDAGKRLAFLTNNSSRAPAGLAAKLRRLGIACTDDEVIAAGGAAIDYLRRCRMDGGAGVYIAGSEELRGYARGAGLPLADADCCGAVLVGLDVGFTFQALAAGLQALARGVPFIVCNRDASFPGDGGRLLPGCGALVAAFEAASGRRADLDIGKPSPILFEMVCDRYGVRPEHCLIIGDSLDADIELARRVGVPGVLVCGGDHDVDRGAVLTVASLRQLAESLDGPQPTANRARESLTTGGPE